MRRSNCKNGGCIEFALALWLTVVNPAVSNNRIVLRTPEIPAFYVEHYVKTTAYTIGDDYTPGHLCADGNVPREGFVAFNGVPFGTVIYIDKRRYEVHDRTLHDGVVDIYIDNRDKALEYGVKYKEVVIVD